MYYMVVLVQIVVALGPKVENAAGASPAPAVSTVSVRVMRRTPLMRTYKLEAMELHITYLTGERRTRRTLHFCQDYTKPHPIMA